LKILLRYIYEKKVVRIVLKSQSFFGVKLETIKGAGGVKTVSVLLFGRTPKPATKVGFWIGSTV